MPETIDHGGYVEHVASPGELIQETVSAGETLQNVLYNIEASGATVQLTVRGQGWTLRNVGVQGRAAGSPQGQPAILIVPRDNASGLVENCYFGDGSLDGVGTKVFWHNEQPGPITWRRCNIGGFHDNGLYASPTAKMGDDGPIEGTLIHIEDCLFYNNNSWQIKIGSPHGTCTVENTVFDTSDPDYAAAYEPSAPTDRNLRYLTIQNHPYDDSHTVVDFVNCDFFGDSSRYTHEFDIECGCIANLENCRANDVVIDRRIGNDGCNPDVPGQVNGTFEPGADPTPPAGVPMSALEAASGEPVDDPEPPGEAVPDGWDYALIVDGQTADPIAEYEFKVRGDVEASDLFGSPINHDILEMDATADGVVVSNAVAGSGNTYLIDGCIEWFDHLSGHTPEFYWTATTEGEVQPLVVGEIADCEDEPDPDPPDDPDPECETDADCPDGYICVDGECVPDDPDPAPPDDPGRERAAAYVLAAGLALAAAREYKRRR